MSDIAQPPTGEAAGRERIRGALDRFLAEGGPRRVLLVDAVQPPVPGATCSRSPRLVLTLRGTNHQDLPGVHGVDRVAVEAGAAVVLTPRAWNHPTWATRYDFLTLDWRDGRVRCYLRSHTRPRAIDGSHWIWLREAPSSATSVLVQALMDLARLHATAAAIPATRALLVQARADLDLPPDTAGTATWLRLRDWVDEHLDRPIDRTTVAVACGVHPHHVTRCFAQRGEGFVAYLRRRRLERSVYLLADERLSIATIAASCGFQSPEYFCNSFRQRHGLSPRAWRKRQN